MLSVPLVCGEGVKFHGEIRVKVYRYPAYLYTDVPPPWAICLHSNPLIHPSPRSPEPSSTHKAGNARNLLHYDHREVTEQQCRVDHISN